MALIPQLLKEFYEPFESSVNSFVAIDWKETPEAHIVKADLPGLKKEDVKVELQNGGKVLQISGKRGVEKDAKDGEKDAKDGERWHRVERPRGEFMRRLYLPKNVKRDEVKGSMENGVLTITIPKEEVKKPEVKQIEIGGN